MKLGSTSPKRREALPRRTWNSHKMLPFLQHCTLCGVSFERAPSTKGALSSHRKWWILVNGMHDVVSGHTISARTRSGLVTSWIPVNGMQRCGIGLHDIHRLMADQQTPGFWGVTKSVLEPLSIFET